MKRKGRRRRGRKNRRRRGARGEGVKGGGGKEEHEVEERTGGREKRMDVDCRRKRRREQMIESIGGVIMRGMRIADHYYITKFTDFWALPI